ncbi:MAG: PA14 domain-containing protein [Bacteroidota bacterium]
MKTFENFKTALLVMAFAWMYSGLLSAQSNGNNYPATDHLGRKLPTYQEVGDLKEDKVAAIFYFTWHEAFAKFQKVQDLAKIEPTLPPEAMSDYYHEAWDPYDDQYTFHFDEPLFDYYGGADEWVLRKHVEMLSNAGVDVLICDATNGDYTWKDGYDPLLKVLAEAKADGVEVPQFAFMMNLHHQHEFTVSSLVKVYRDLYKPGRYSDLMFKWEGKPVVMALWESLLEVSYISEAAMRFTATESFGGCGVECPSWSNNIGNLTLSLYQWNTDYNNSVAQAPIASVTHENFTDNAQLNIEFTEQLSGDYLLVVNEAKEDVGIWKFAEETPGVTSYFNKEVVTGDYHSYIKYTSEGSYSPLTQGNAATHVPVPIPEAFDQDELVEILDFFTFRATQAAYNTGPNKPYPQWAWLEIYPQNKYVDNGDGTFEFMTVGVAQNWSDALGGLTSMNAGSTVFGRSYTYKDKFSRLDDNSYLYGYNFQEQWDRALEFSPEIVFIDQWNEWVMGRHGEGEVFMGMPVSFPDAYNLEYSRDIEPMRDAYKDAYYYQMTANIRRFKGMEAPEAISAKKTVVVDGVVDEWIDVTPGYTAHKGNTKHRDGLGYVREDQPVFGARHHYVNTSGRNDIVGAKVARDNDHVYFYVECAEELTAPADTLWMRLFIDIDRYRGTGWEGYDFMLNRISPGAKAILEKCTDNQWDWTEVAQVDYAVNGKYMELGIPKSSLGINQDEEATLEFKWADNSISDGDIMDFWVDGDVAPAGRFNYNYGALVPQTSYKDHQIPGTIEFEDFDKGGAGVSYGDNSIGNAGGAYRVDEAVDIFELTAGEYHIGEIDSAEWLEYTIHVSALGQYQATIHYASADVGNKAIISIDGKEHTGEISFPATGGSDTWATLDLELQLSVGTHLLKFEIKETSGELRLDKTTITETNVAYPGDGEGLIRSFWNGAPGGRGWFKDSLCSETDSVINEVWADESPGCGANKDFWNARWQGEIEALFSEEYTFYLTVKNLGRVWINDELLIDAWTSAASGKTHPATVSMTAGEKASIVVEYANLTGDGYAKLEWESASNPLEVVPQSQLFPKVITGFLKNIRKPVFAYPNPISNSLYITAEGAKIEGITVYDLHGKTVYRSTTELPETAFIDTQQWEQGIYFLRVEINGMPYSIKTVKILE